MKRVVVCGSTGSGKTTLAKRLAGALGARYVELDALYHGPNWTPTPDDLFRERVAAFVSEDRWVVDGNYGRVRDILWPRAQTIVWLDYELPVILWRLFWRVLMRGIRRQELWHGNRESLWAHFFTRESLFLWALQTHGRRRRELPEWLARPEYGHLKVHRFGSPREVERWLAGVTRTGARL